jgi:dephospho-CoA kinase
MIVGLTGGIGSGKSAVAAMFAELGIPVVDTDLIAHALTAPGQPGLQHIAAVFGSELVREDGQLDRAALRQRVFADASARKALESVLHPMIREEARRQLALPSTAPYRLLVVPLLFETNGYETAIDRSLLVDCDESLQIARTRARSGMDESQVHAIMAAQCSRSQRLARANDVIVNEGTLEELRQQVLEKHKKYIRLA